MLILTIQKREVAEQIKNGSYKPDFWQSPFSCMSVGFTKGYSVILDALKKKTGVEPFEGETCMWGWVKAPYIQFHTSAQDWTERVALFVEVPDKEVVLSDFDKFSDYVFGEELCKNQDFLLDTVPAGDETCVQGSFWGIKPENILLEVSLKSLLGRDAVTSVESLYISIVLMLNFEYLKNTYYSEN